MRPQLVVGFDGQSLANRPDDATCYASVAMRALTQTRPWGNACLNGVSIAGRTVDAATRCDLLCRGYQWSLLLLDGGTAELAAGMTGPTLLAAQEAYADARRTAGWQRIVGFTCPPSTAFTAPQELERVAYNTALRVSSHFDGIVDQGAAPQLANPADVTFYADGTHYTAAGAAVVAALIAPLLRRYGIL